MTEYSLESGSVLPEADPVQTIEVTQVLDADEFANLLLTSIATSLTNPRTIFDQSKLGELASSIKASGVHQPVLVRPLPASRLADTFDLHRARFGGRNTERPTHELVCGERRYRACLIAGVKRIPALIRELTDHQVLEIQIVENLQRDDLSELEEAVGF
ncbi:MAG: ParB/RepB/Spo0J family partition protein, partial [Rhodoferax sp.]